MSFKHVIVIVGSRSGGHILPGLEKGKELYAQGSAVYFIAENRPLDRSLLQHETWLSGRMFLSLSTPSVRLWWKYPWYGISCVVSLISCIRVLYRIKPAQVLAMGGYSSFLVCCAAFILRIPYLLYEFNAELGRAVSWLRFGAQRVVCCFPEALRYVPVASKQLSAYPIRYTDDSIMSMIDARKQLGLAETYTLFVLGGSQGSHALNVLVMEWVAGLDPSQRICIQIIHQAGRYAETIRSTYEKLQVPKLVFDYKDDLAACYCAADLIVTRAGAGALHEVMHFRKRALIVPLETDATRHQVANAESVQARDPANWVMIGQHNRQGVHAFLTSQLVKG